MFMLIALGVFTAACVILFAVRHVVGLFWTASSFYALLLAYVSYGFDPPVPSSVVLLYAVTSLCALLLYVTASEDSRKEYFGPIVAVLSEKKLLPLRIIVVLAVPALIAWQSHNASLPNMTPPPKTRSVHPPPPGKITFTGHGETVTHEVDIIGGNNPFRELESDPEKWAAHMKLGKKVYYQNCYFCHGDKLEADGHYAVALRPTPANFLDPGNLPMLQETFVFWRVAKGGPGMPDAGTPWDSSMPVWEKMLTWEETWAAIGWMYDFTGYKPRTQESAEH